MRLERRLEFLTYESTRDFLDRLGDLCENRKRFPDISFGKTYVNLTLKPEDENQITDLDKKFASEIDELTNN
ncbi:putative pterin-4 alpha-carbinolamine dehydratase-like protein [Prochlorococcus sp. MIT 0603]|nr:putative pterin-4 alpha-carbinolamine dehydratase-like protein [Prochlorococcus sp. MIT 0603]